MEVGVNEYAGFNRCEWTCDATKYMGKLFKTCDTSAGENIPYRRNIRLVRSFRNQKLIKSGYTVKNILRFL